MNAPITNGFLPLRRSLARVPLWIGLLRWMRRMIVVMRHAMHLRQEIMALHAYSKKSPQDQLADRSQMVGAFIRNCDKD